MYKIEFFFKHKLHFTKAKHSLDSGTSSVSCSAELPGGTGKKWKNMGTDHCKGTSLVEESQRALRTVLLGLRRKNMGAVQKKEPKHSSCC